VKKDENSRNRGQTLARRGLERVCNSRRGGACHAFILLWSKSG